METETADVVLEPSHPLLRHQLEPYAEELRAGGYRVELIPPMEERGAFPPSLPYDLFIIVAASVWKDAYSWIKDSLGEWFKRRPLRGQGPRRLQVQVTDENGDIVDEFELRDENGK